MTSLLVTGIGELVTNDSETGDGSRLGIVRDAAILMDGSGIGMSIAANKVCGVRAALAHDEVTARRAREHNHCNVLCLGTDLLSEDQIRQIVEIELGRVKKQLASQEIALVMTEEAMDHIATVGYDSNFGARPLGRAIQNEIEDPLAEMLLQGGFRSGDTVKIEPRDGKLVIEKVVEERKPEPVAT